MDNISYLWNSILISFIQNAAVKSLKIWFFFFEKVLIFVFLKIACVVDDVLM